MSSCGSYAKSVCAIEGKVEESESGVIAVCGDCSCPGASSLHWTYSHVPN